MTTATRSRHEASLSQPRTSAPCPRSREPDLEAGVQEILNRRPAVGLAVGVVRDGRLAFFHGHGLADIASNTPITEDTVFRIGSITKLFTAIAVMQLWEQGLVDLDAPANDYLRAYKLVPAQAGWRPATLRHLLTHTAGIPEVRGVADLLQSDLTPSGGRPAHLSVQVRRAAAVTRRVLPRRSADRWSSPGRPSPTRNHGFATLGQIVEDVSGLPLERYFRERIFEPLGMTDTDLVRSERRGRRVWRPGTSSAGAARSRSPTATGSAAGAGGIYSTARDMARFAAALLGRRRQRARHGSSSRRRSRRCSSPTTSRIRASPASASRFFRGDVGGHRTVGARRDPAGLQLGTLARARRWRRRHRLHEWLERGDQLAPDRARPPAAAAARASPTTSCAATFPITPRSGPTSAVGTSSRRGSATSVVGSC